MKLQAWFIALALGLVSLAAESGLELFQKAVALEKATGNLEEAIKVYQRIVKEFPSDRALVAKALMQEAHCYELREPGEQDKAVKIYEQITRDFGDQRQAVETARARLAPLRFEVASVRKVDPNKAFVYLVPREVGPEWFRSREIAYRLIQWAFNVKPFQISGGSRWIRTDYFDIEAKTESPASPDQMKRMAQRLLEERFQLKSHRELRETSVDALLADKNGPKLKAAKDDGLCDGNLCFQAGTGFITASGGTLVSTADVLTQLMDHPAIDRTCPTGNYDFRVVCDNSSVKAPMVGMRNAPADGPSIFTAIQDLGLRLEAQELPVEFLIIDSTEPRQRSDRRARPGSAEKEQHDS